MNTACPCKTHHHQRPVAKVLSATLSTLALIALPKCPLCLASYITLLTGLSLSATAAGHLHTGLIVACGSMLLLAMIWLGAAGRHWIKRLPPRTVSR